MNVIQKKIKELQDFQKDIDNIVIDIAEDYQEVIFDMNRDQLEAKGINADGDKITPFYTQYTVSVKKSKGQITDRVTLKDTGDFHQSFYFYRGSKYFIIYADDYKVKSLEKKYGVSILGLTQENLIILGQIIKDELITKLREAT